MLVLLVVLLTMHFLIHRQPFQKVGDTEKYGFESVGCWFGETSALPRIECYYMHVPEDHAQQTDETIVFPVVVFRSNAIFSTKAPVLHLGAGGPGAPMYLDFIESVKTIWEYHDELSTKQGRDLFVIDPRGTGLSKPLLMCDTFVENETKRLKDNLSFAMHRSKESKDYFKCIDKFKNQGIDLSKYNSLSIANDVEMMRIASHIDQWVLVGVSYAATYAQIIATQYPDSVEAMVLDSATFPNIKPHDNYLDKTMASYLALYDYCSLTESCSTPLQNTKDRIWNLHRTLNLNPIQLELDHPYRSSKIDVLLNGERFISSLLNGTYGEKIFSDLPSIITELENRRAHTIIPYVEGYIAYLLDARYGDVSTISHYCYEDKPYTDFESIKKQADELPKGYIRNTALFSINYAQYCNEIDIGVGNPVVSMPTKTDIPSLFLHGKLDTITPLSDVVEQRKLFTNSRIVTYDFSHDVISSDECAEIVAAKFVRNSELNQLNLDCH